MTNTTLLHGLCPPPFYQESLFPSTGGFIDGRYCAPLDKLYCCLPCPIDTWTYSDTFVSQTQVPQWIAVAMLPLCAFLLLTYAVLPVKWTHRHYMSICFTLGICCMEIAFIIPLGSKPDQCYNEITPNDMHSNLSCAFTGALLLFGGLVVIMWSFIRTVALHLQVCWEIMLGPMFMWGALIWGWGAPAILATVMLIYTGVSFRLGSVCHINIQHSLQDYWIPIMVFSGVSLILQLITMVYCMYIYVKSLFSNDTSTNNSGLTSYNASVRTVSARQAYKRIKRVLELQWRGASLSLVIIGNVIFFALTFIDLNNTLKLTPANLLKAEPWLLCLIATGGDKAACIKEAETIRPNEAKILALLILLAMVGIWNFTLFVRPSMFLGWAEFFQGLFGMQNMQVEFVSADARKVGDSRSYEMLSSSGLPSYKSPEPVVRSPSPARITGTTSPGAGSHYGQEARYVRSPSPTRAAGTTSPGGGSLYAREARYVRPSMSFSGPRRPSASQGGRDWDPSNTFASANHQEYNQYNPYSR